MSNWLDTPLLKVMEKGLDTASLRQKVIANNVSNLETPGFKRSDVDFQKAFETALGKDANLSLKHTSAQHLDGVAFEQQILVTDPSSIQANGNNVDIDREMTNVAENGIYFNALSRATTMQMGLLRLLITQK